MEKQLLKNAENSLHPTIKSFPDTWKKSVDNYLQVPVVQLHTQIRSISFACQRINFIV